MVFMAWYMYLLNPCWMAEGSRLSRRPTLSLSADLLNVSPCWKFYFTSLSDWFRKAIRGSVQGEAALKNHYRLVSRLPFCISRSALIDAAWHGERPQNCCVGRVSRVTFNVLDVKLCHFEFMLRIPGLQRNYDDFLVPFCNISNFHRFINSSFKLDHHQCSIPWHCVHRPLGALELPNKAAQL